MLEFIFRRRPLPLVPEADVREADARFGKLRVELQGFHGRRLGAQKGGARRHHAIARHQRVAVGQPCVGERVVRIERDGLLEVFDALAQVFFGAPVPVVAAFEVELISGGVFGVAPRQPLLLCAGELQPQVLGDLRGHLLFNVTNVTKRVADLAAPEVRAVERVNQLGLDDDPFAALQDAPDEHGADVQLAPDAHRVRLLRVQTAGGAHLVTEDRRARHHAQARQRRERVNQRLGDAFRQVIGLRIAAQVD